VVQLPQSIEYRNPVNLAADKEFINSLPPGMLAIMARTTDSLQHLQEHYPETKVLQSPDMALTMGPFQSGPPQYDVLFLMRGDHEATEIEALLPGAGKSKGTRWHRLKTYASKRLRPLKMTFNIRDWQYRQEGIGLDSFKVWGVPETAVCVIGQSEPRCIS
jgi:exopolysaccharide biosynthesis predicted pyruvyltransferase EpsI